MLQSQKTPQDQEANKVAIFNHPQFGDVRTSTNEQGEPVFCLADVCKPLGLSVTKVNQRLEEGVLSRYPLCTNGGIQLATFVNEDGLYDVILDSRKPAAKAFRKWVTSDVLPSIRKTGGYIAVKADDTEDDILARALLIAQSKIGELKGNNELLRASNDALRQHNEVLKEQSDEQTRQLAIAAPKVEAYDQVLQSSTVHTFTECAKELGFRSGRAMLDKLIQIGVLFRQSGRYLPRAEYSDKGYFTSKTHPYTNSRGDICTEVYTVVTETGRLFLHDMFRLPVCS